MAQLEPAYGRHLVIAVSSQVNVHLTLAEEREAILPGGRYTFQRLSFWADDTDLAMRELRTTIGRTRS